MDNVNRQLSMIFGRVISLSGLGHAWFRFPGAYPTLYDTANNKHYVGFESIYEYSRSQPVSALLFNEETIDVLSRFSAVRWWTCTSRHIQTFIHPGLCKSFAAQFSHWFVFVVHRCIRNGSMISIKRPFGRCTITPLVSRPVYSTFARSTPQLRRGWISPPIDVPRIQTNVPIA